MASSAVDIRTPAPTIAIPTNTKATATATMDATR